MANYGANENGTKGVKWAIGILSAVGGGFGGALAAGIWLGTTATALETHIANPEIHQSRAAKEGIAQVVVDREVKPALQDIQRRLDRIESKLDDLGR